MKLVQTLARLVVGAVTLVWATLAAFGFLGYISKVQDDGGCMAAHPGFAIIEGLIALAGVSAAAVFVSRRRLAGLLIAAGLFGIWMIVVAFAHPSPQMVGWVC